VERISIITGLDWQHCVIGTIRLFVHPEVRAYDKSWAMELRCSARRPCRMEP
jgi:hypothetical protein